GRARSLTGNREERVDIRARMALSRAWFARDSVRRRGTVADAISRGEVIFLAVADVAPADRESLLQERCGHDPRLRAEVDAMLLAIEVSDDGFLDPPRLPALDNAAVHGPMLPG